MLENLNKILEGLSERHKRRLSTIIYVKEKENDKNIGYSRNNLTILKYLGSNRKQCRLYLAKCACGNYAVVDMYQVRHDITKSCGCIRDTNHGRTQDPLFKIYYYLQRYENQTKIKILSDKWSGTKGVDNFYNWAMKQGYHPNMRIVRKDNFSEYSPENCILISKEEYAHRKRYQRNSTYLYCDGYTLHVNDWAEITGINRETIISRINLYGWTIEKALHTPVPYSTSVFTGEIPEEYKKKYNQETISKHFKNPPRLKFLTYAGKTFSIKKWGQITGLDPKVIRTRIMSNWTIEKTLNTPTNSMKKRGILEIKFNFQINE